MPCCLSAPKDIFGNGFWSMVAVGITAPSVGTLLILRRMPFLGIAVPQVAGAGVALSFLVYPLVGASVADVMHPSDVEPPPITFQLAGAALALLLALSILALLGRRGRATGVHAAVAYLIALGLSELFLLESRYEELADQWLHHGRVLTVLPEGMYLVLAASAVALCVTILCCRAFWVTAFDSDQARLSGLSPGRWLLITLLVIGGYAALTVPEIGPEAILVMMIIPPVILRRVTPSLRAYGPLCALAGGSGAVVAFYPSWNEDWPMGPSLTASVLATSLVMALLAWIVRWLHAHAGGPSANGAR